MKQIFIGDEEVWLVSEEEKLIPARTVIGTFGGGSYVAPKPNDVGLSYDFPDGDRTLVFFEGYDTTPSGVMTFYSMCRVLEDKGIVNFKVANLELSREANSTSTADAITLKKTANKVFKFATDTSDATAGKMFWRTVKQDAIKKSTTMVPCFRFRYEKVGKNLKPTKIFAVTKIALKLKANTPRRVV